MAIWTELARASNEAGDEILLRCKDDLYEIRYNGLELMSNVNFQSEKVLAERSIRLLDHLPKNVLIGGLGMGFTLRAALNMLPKQTAVTVCEFVPEIVDWNHARIGHLAAFPLNDPRVDVCKEDVMDNIRHNRNHYDLILMDSDNGPDFLVRNGNDKIYAKSGLRSIDYALKHGGIASFWSATVSTSFEELLNEMEYNWERHDVCLIAGRADAFHHIYFIGKNLPSNVSTVSQYSNNQELGL